MNNRKMNWWKMQFYNRFLPPIILLILMRWKIYYVFLWFSLIFWFFWWPLADADSFSLWTFFVLSSIISISQTPPRSVCSSCCVGMLHFSITCIQTSTHQTCKMYGRKMSKKMIDSLLEHRSCLLCRYRTYTLRLRRDCIQNLCNHCGLDKPVHISQCLLQDRRIFLTTQTNPQWNSHPEKYHKENSLQHRRVQQTS